MEDDTEDDDQLELEIERPLLIPPLNFAMVAKGVYRCVCAEDLARFDVAQR